MANSRDSQDQEFNITHHASASSQWTERISLRLSSIEEALGRPNNPPTLTPNVYQQVVADKSTGPLRIALIRIIDSTCYNIFISGIISFNIFLVIYEADASRPEKPNAWNTTAGWIMLCVFTWDSCLRMISLGDNFYKSYADIFDGLIVLSDWILEIAAIFFNLGEAASLTAMKTLRILRVIRIIRRFLVFRELYLMMKGMLTAMRTIMFASFLLTLVIMFFAVLSVQYVKPIHSRLGQEGLICDYCDEAYSSVENGMLTIFSTIIAGDSWGLINNVIIREAPLTALIIVGATIVIQLGLLNLIIAVIVDRAHAARVEDQELVHIMKQEELVKSFTSLKRVFEEIDTDGSGSLSMDELLTSFDNCELFRHQLNVMDITKDDLHKIFDILDKDGDGEVSYHEFVNQLHVIKNANPHTLLVILTHQAELWNRTLEMRLDKVLKQVQCVGHFAELAAEKAALGAVASITAGQFQKTEESSILQSKLPENLLADLNSSEGSEGLRSQRHSLKDSGALETDNFNVDGQIGMSGLSEMESVLNSSLSQMLALLKKEASMQTTVVEVVRPLTNDICTKFDELKTYVRDAKQSMAKQSDCIICSPIGGAHMPRKCFASKRELPKPHERADPMSGQSFGNDVLSSTIRLAGVESNLHNAEASPEPKSFLHSDYSGVKCEA